MMRVCFHAGWGYYFKWLSVGLSVLSAKVFAGQTEAEFYMWKNDSFVVMPYDVGPGAHRFDDNFWLEPKPAPERNAWFTSQLGQDEFIMLLNDYKEKGFFVDLAANDYSFLSNTGGIEKYYKWDGICIEPNPQYHSGILFNRKCKLVSNPVYSKNNHMVHFHLDDWASGIVGEDMDNKKENKGVDMTLQTVTLTEILKYFNAPKIIDYLSLDVEGGELHVMKHVLHNSEHVFLTMTVERPTPHLHEILHKHKYWMLTQLPLKTDPAYEITRKKFGEIVYIHESHPKFKNHMVKYRPGAETTWFDEDHPFLNKPKWVE